MEDRAPAGGDTYLGLDLGTTNIKALLVDTSGAVLSSGSAPVGSAHLPNGGVEQDIGEIWQAAVEAIRGALGAEGGQADRGARRAPRAIGVSSQGGAMQILHTSGAPLGPVIGWQDTRGEPWSRSVTGRLGAEWFARRVGFSSGGSAIGQILRLREQGGLPEGFRVGFVGDVIVGRLCGRRAHDPTSLSECCLLNPSTGQADTDVLALLGLRQDHLPDLLPAAAPAGGLTPEAARATGLDAGIPVCPAVHDQYAAAVGCGAVRPGDVMFGAGTAWVLLTVGDRLSPPIPGVSLVGPHPVTGLFGQMLSLVNGGSCLSWALATLGMQGAGSEVVDRMIRSVPPGSGGLTFRPLLSPHGGAGLPPGTAGRLDGIRLEHTPAHLVRAVVEGLACELARYLRLLREGDVRVERLVMCGRAAASGETPRIIADTCDIPVDLSAEPDTSALGAAVFARAACEPARGLGELAAGMQPGMKRVLPGPGRGEAARRLEAYLASLPRG